MLHNMAIPSRYQVLPPIGMQTGGTRNPMSLLPAPTLASQTMNAFGPPSSLQIYLHGLAQRENMIRNAFADYLKPVCSPEGEIMLDVECGENRGLLYLSRFCQGSKGPCIRFEDMWLTPNEFQYISGRESAKDWKRSIRHQGKSLKLLLAKGILTVHPSSCSCTGCRISSPVNRGKLSGYSPRMTFDDMRTDCSEISDERRLNSKPRIRSPSYPPHSEVSRQSLDSPELKLRQQTPATNLDRQDLPHYIKSNLSNNGTDWYFDKPLMHHLPGLKARSPAVIEETNTEPLSFLKNLARDSMAVKSENVNQKSTFPFYKPVPQMHPGINNTGNVDLSSSFVQTSRTVFNSSSGSQASAFYQLSPLSTNSIPTASATSGSSDTPVTNPAYKTTPNGSTSSVSLVSQNSDVPLDLSAGTAERINGTGQRAKPKNPPPSRDTDGLFGKRRRLEKTPCSMPPSTDRANAYKQTDFFRAKRFKESPQVDQKEVYAATEASNIALLNYQAASVDKCEPKAEVLRQCDEDSGGHASDETLERCRSV